MVISFFFLSIIEDLVKCSLKMKKNIRRRRRRGHGPTYKYLHTNTPNVLREQRDKKMRPKPKTKRNQLLWTVLGVSPQRDGGSITKY
jgi:hypothetical protein